jgi:hypothetical protein
VSDSLFFFFTQSKRKWNYGLTTDHIYFTQIDEKISFYWQNVAKHQAKQSSGHARTAPTPWAMRRCRCVNVETVNQMTRLPTSALLPPISTHGFIAEKMILISCRGAGLCFITFNHQRFNQITVKN